MTLIYEQPKPITIQEREYIKQTFLSMVENSKKEFDKWENSRKEIFLKQACEKIFTAIEHFVELKKNIDITKHYQFKHEFRTIKGFNINTVNRLIDRAESLHQFFYNGTMYERDLNIIEEKYLELFNYLKDKINTI